MRITTYSAGGIGVLALLLAAVLAVALPAMVGADGRAKPRYVATMPPVASILANVTEGRATVESLLTANQSHHDFDPRPSHARMLDGATAFFYSADSVEPWVDRLPTAQRVELLALIPEADRLMSVGHEECHEGHDHDHHHHGEALWDGHWWLDPLAIRSMLPALVGRLSEIDPEGRAVYEVNAAAFGERLTALDAELAAMLAPVKGQVVVTVHSAYRYMFRRYGLEDGGVVAVDGQEPPPGHLRRLAADLKERNVRAIFTEAQLPRRSAEALGEEAGIPVHMLDPEGGTATPEGIGELLRKNTRVLAEALAAPPA